MNTVIPRYFLSLSRTLSGATLLALGFTLTFLCCQSSYASPSDQESVSRIPLDSRIKFRFTETRHLNIQPTTGKTQLCSNRLGTIQLFHNQASEDRAVKRDLEMAVIHSPNPTKLEDSSFWLLSRNDFVGILKTDVWFMDGHSAWLEDVSFEILTPEEFTIGKLKELLAACGGSFEMSPPVAL